MTITMSSAHSPTIPSLQLHHNSFYNPSVALPTSQLILQPFCHFTYVIAHSPTLLCSFSNHSITSSTSQLILQPFCHFINITAHSPTLLLLHLRHSSFSNPSFASLTSQVLHLIHLASCPWWRWYSWVPSVLRMGILTNFKFWIVKKGHEIMQNTQISISLYIGTGT